MPQCTNLFKNNNRKKKACGPRTFLYCINVWNSTVLVLKMYTVKVSILIKLHCLGQVEVLQVSHNEIINLINTDASF